MKEKNTIMIVDDEAIIALDISGMLKMRGFSVTGPYSTGESAIQAVQQSSPDCILMDIMLSGAIDGIETTARIKSIADIPVIYLTAHSDDPTLERAKATNPHGYVLKPINSKELFSVIEITLYKHEMELKLKESELMFRRLFELSPIALCLVGENGFAESINIRFTQIVGYTMDDLSGVNEWWPRAVPDDDYRYVVRDEWNRNIQKILSGESEYISFEGSIVCRDNSVKYIICGLSGLGKKCIVSFNDITERKNAQDELQRKQVQLEIINRELNVANEELEATNEEFEAQNREMLNIQQDLAESEERYRSIFNNFPDAVVILEEGHIIDANDLACTLFDAQAKTDMSGLTPVDLSPVKQSDGTDSRVLAGQMLKETLKKGRNVFQWLFKKTNCDMFYAEVVLTCYQFHGKKMIHAIIRDITWK